MTNDDKDLNQAVNTNQTIYRQPTTDYGPEDGNDKGMEPSVFLTKEGAIGFNHYGKCAVKSIKEWVEMAWNSRATPQQPSEPLKELDEKAILMVLDQCCPVSMDKMAKEMIAQILWNKFGQPSEKKALSVDSIKTILTKIMKKELVDIGEHFCFVCGEPMSEEKRGLLIDYIAQAIHSALPAQREVRYPDTAYVDKNDGKPGRIEKINYCLGWNHCIDEFKKLNGG